MKIENTQIEWARIKTTYYMVAKRNATKTMTDQNGTYIFCIRTKTNYRNYDPSILCSNL